MSQWRTRKIIELLEGNCLDLLKELEAERFSLCITSPPYYGLRDYRVEGQIGLESTPQEYVKHLVEVFDQVKRVLRKDGTLCLNLGDTYYNKAGIQVPDKKRHTSEETWLPIHPPNRQKIEGLKPTDLIGVPWMVAFALRDAGWFLRSDIIWAKPNPTPEGNVKSRPIRSHEYIFMLTKSRNSYFNYDGMKETGEWNGALRDVWTITKTSGKDHRATFPAELPLRCIKAFCPEGGEVLDPFAGSGTTGLAAQGLGHDCTLIELSPESCDEIERRLS